MTLACIVPNEGAQVECSTCTSNVNMARRYEEGSQDRETFRLRLFITQVTGRKRACGDGLRSKDFAPCGAHSFKQFYTLLSKG